MLRQDRNSTTLFLLLQRFWIFLLACWLPLIKNVSYFFL